MALATELGGYTLLEKIAIGGMAEVYRACAAPGTQRSADEPEEVALKRLLPRFRAEQAFIDLFVQEGRLCVRLKHANLVRTFKVFKKGLDYFMVQELVDGRNLAAIHERARSRGIPVGVAGAVFAVRALLSALEYVHQLRFAEGVATTAVHGDINPSNVLVGKTGEVKLTDFGVAMAEGTPSHGEGGSLRGTMTHMAPEQVLGKPIDKRADLFAAGVILWELLANRQLIDSVGPYEVIQRAREARVPLLSTLRSDLPDLLVQIV
ncbi:MAG: serine/threonine protein kinase, partial [Deltaproteobacteria bacterium]|nr:serine/threonine protein kinase [Deltaproteobacteria bacterium]